MRRDLTTGEPDQVRCGDVTGMGTVEGKPCPATVVDPFSRRLPGYTTGTRHDAEPVVAPSRMAAAIRDGDVRDVILHPDRGSEHNSRHFGRVCRHLGMIRPVGRLGCFDNALSRPSVNSLRISGERSRPAGGVKGP
ncbi:DDE-type integrase/transposase/recombinase [Streptomyces sp. NPDC057910]|uniref:DDE-type integrase/transposase/recombinase n=1 Tax=Streptomyces sp. NPDC057910 TaxID=3346278 RepID=UPI0036F06DCF